MTFWFAYSVGLIFVAATAMLSEGVDRWFVAKLAGSLSLAAFIVTGDYHFTAANEPVAAVVSSTNTVASSMATPRKVQSITVPKVTPTGTVIDPEIIQAAGEAGIDFNPTCGGGKVSNPAPHRNPNIHTEIAKLNDGGAKPHC